MNLKYLLLAGAAMVGCSANCFAAENVLSDNKSDLQISIYNQNLALVKDERPVTLRQGINEIAFEGVATQIKPETAILYADGIKVLEQNYDYDLMNAANIVDKSVGQKVKTVIMNPTTGENIFNSATIVSAAYGNPVLQFDYGIETNFPGRLVFEKMPASLRSKPTLIAKVNSVAAADKKISLAYLTNGIGWKTNYVAKVTGADELNLTAWVTINNQSGVDYKNANVQLVAGDVNQVAPEAGGMRTMRLMAKAAMPEYAMDTAANGTVSEAVSGYHLYTLPLKTDIKDNQTKQISLLEKNGVKFRKEAVLNSPLYFNPGANAEFKQQHPDMVYILNNVEKDNLGVALPSGIMRFYENDSSGNMQFIGENSISHVAKGEEMRLGLGTFFNIFVNGKVASINKLGEEKGQPDNGNCYTLNSVYEYKVEVTFNNGGNTPQEVVLLQQLPRDAEVSAESIKGRLKYAGTYEWRVNVPADGKRELNFTVKTVDKRRSCR